MAGLVDKSIKNVERYGFSRFIWNATNVPVRNTIPDRFLTNIGFSKISGIVSRENLKNHDNVDIVIYLTNSELINIGDPCATKSIPDLFEKYSGMYQIPRSFVCQMNNISLLGTRALGVDQNNRVILETMVSRYDLLHKYFRMKPVDTFSIWRNIGQTGPRVSENIVSLVEYYDGFHHWIYNSLPMLQGVKRFEDKTGEKCRILLPPNPPSYVTESLELFGYDNDDILQWNGGVATFDSLIIPSVRRIENTDKSPADLSRKIISPSAARWMRDELKERIGDTDSRYSKNVIISRGDVGTREIANKDEVYSKLERFGYVPYRLAEMSFKEQVSLFNSAENIVSPHGAGLSNLCFAEQPNVIEILGTNIERPTYYLLAEALGFDYGIVIGDQNSEGDHNSDITVDLSELTKVMGEMNMRT